MHLSRRAWMGSGALAWLALAVAAEARIWQKVSALVHPPRLRVRTAQQADAARRLPALRDVMLETRDGLSLSAWYVPGQKRASVLLVHGIGSNRTALLPEAVRLASRGYGVLAYDARDHGDSQGDRCTWGDGERNDVEAAVDFLAATPDGSSIGAIGFSVGGAAVALAARADPRLRALVIEGAFPSFVDLERSWHPGYEALWSGAAAPAFAWFGVRRDELNVVAALRARPPGPLFVVFGSDDPAIAPPLRRAFFEGAPEPKQEYVVANAGHGGYASVAGDVYLDRLVAFFDDALLRGPR